MAKKLKKIKPTPKPYRIVRFGIRNHVGSLWTPEFFRTREAADEYLDRAKNEWKPEGELDAHEVVLVRVTISEIH